jgi:hypothetical protein
MMSEQVASGVEKLSRKGKVKLTGPPREVSKQFAVEKPKSLREPKPPMNVLGQQ